MSSMQPVSMLMSNLNLESTAKHAPNALAAAQDTAQSQEIIREGIRIVQTVQANEAAAQAQRVHRKNAGDEENGQGRQGQQDSYTHTEQKHEENIPESAPLIRENVRSKKSFDFLA